MNDPATLAPRPADAAADRFQRRARSLTQELVESLGAQLRSGVIKPGDRLPTELALMQAYGVSRGVVREALSRLAAAGQVQTQHGIGTFALEAGAAAAPLRLRTRSGVVDLAEMLDVLELRASVESDAAALAALRRSDDQLREMRRALDDFAVNLKAVGETVAPDFRFHLAIARATGNRYFGDLMSHLGSAVIPTTRVSSARLRPERREQHLRKVNQEHLDIYAAIERRDPEAARAAMRLHLVNSRERQRQAHTAEGDASEATKQTAAPRV